MAITGPKAIKAYFESDNGRTVALSEIRALSPEDRKELGDLCAAELNGKGD